MLSVCVCGGGARKGDGGLGGAMHNASGQLPACLGGPHSHGGGASRSSAKDMVRRGEQAALFDAGRCVHALCTCALFLAQAGTGAGRRTSALCRQPRTCRRTRSSSCAAPAPQLSRSTPRSGTTLRRSSRWVVSWTQPCGVLGTQPCVPTLNMCLRLRNYQHATPICARALLDLQLSQKVGRYPSAVALARFVWQHAHTLAYATALVFLHVLHVAVARTSSCATNTAHCTPPPPLSWRCHQ